MEMRQDALLAKGDLLKAHQGSSRSDANKALRDETFIGDAQVASKKRKNKKKKGQEWTPPSLFGEWKRAQST